MIRLIDHGVFLTKQGDIIENKDIREKDEGRKKTMAYGILQAHNKSGDRENLKLTFDALVSPDNNYVNILQTARASGIRKFPVPYVLSNCHHTLCAVGGTINEDDHVFGLGNAKKYGGIFVPPYRAVLHQYMRERMAGGGRMILGSDSHTRYGALGTMAIGEGGGELVKQLLCDTYDVNYPGVVAIYLDGKPGPGVGPQDIALAIIGAVYKSGYVKNKVMEFVGPGVASMTTDFRNGIDVMTTETTCLSSIWRTDEDTKEFLAMHGRGEEYRELNPADVAYYDGVVYVDMSTVKPMIALPFHPSNTYEIDELNANLGDILRSVEVEATKVTGNPDIRFSMTDKIVNGKLLVTQGVIAGCAGGNYTNVMEAAHILRGKSCGADTFSLSVYPSSQPVYIDLVRKGAIADLMAAGAVLKTAFCGPCFGAGDTPANNGFSIRHTTRNFPNREGSKPGVGQMAAVALMDARSIAATAANGGRLTAATDVVDGVYEVPAYEFDDSVYRARIYQGYKKGDREKELVYGPNIKDWPEMSPLTDNILLKVCSKIMDAVTTTDELIPSGETSSYRSNPLGLAEFTLSRRDPGYVGRSKAVDKIEKARVAGISPCETEPELKAVFDKIRTIPGNENAEASKTEVGSMVYARKPGDGSAREQAASCQRVIGGLANICTEYATKRYRSNVMNWGMLPFQMEGEPDDFEVGSYIYVPGIKAALDGDMKDIRAYVIGNEVKEIRLYIADMTPDEKKIVKAGSLINFNRNR